MQTLIEDYKRRINSATKMMEDEAKKTDLDYDHTRCQRLSTKISCYRTFIAELEQFKKEHNQGDIEAYSEVAELDNPWPLKEVLKKLKFATEYLLHEKNYDGRQHEELNLCVKRAGEVIAKLESLHT